MNIILIVLVLLWTIVKTIASFLWEHKLQIFCAILILFFLSIAYLIFSNIWAGILNRRKEKNEIALRKYLEENCLECGYMNSAKWKKLLPQFSGKKYPSGFERITLDFARETERQYLLSESGKWMKPIIRYLVKNGMADIFELTKASNKLLTYTHCTMDAILINSELEKFSEAAEKAGKKVFDQIKLDEESVRNMYPFLGNPVNEAYLNAYKINDDFLMMETGQKGKLVTHEISAADLGIL